MTSCHFSALCRSKATGELTTIRLRCKRWCCPSCSKHLKSQWKRHFADLLDPASNWPVRSIYRRFLTALQFDVARKRIQAQHGQYVRIVQETGILALYATVPFEGSVELTSKAAIDCLFETISNISAERRAISTSRGWKLPADTEDRRFEVIAIQPYFSPEAARLAAKAINDALQQIVVSISTSPDRILFEGTACWTNDAIRTFISLQNQAQFSLNPNYSLVRPASIHGNSERRSVQMRRETPVADLTL